MGIELLEKHIKERTGERRQMNCGLYVTIIKYKCSDFIDVQFDDGVIIENRKYRDFLLGKIRYPINRIGEENIMSCGLKATIIDYKNKEDITIQFEDGDIVEHRNYRRFLEGKIGHPGINARKSKGE